MARNRPNVKPSGSFNPNNDISKRWQTEIPLEFDLPKRKVEKKLNELRFPQTSCPKTVTPSKRRPG
jgi:hypothetical protein